MDRATKLLLGGIILGGITVGFGQVRVWQLEKHIEELKLECARESEETKQLSIQQHNLDFQLLCDPEDLLQSKTEKPAPGIQGKLMHTQGSLNRWKEIPTLLGLGLFVILSVPWCWYFLLRRVRELSKAIAGK
ncbi:hypothetical protein EPO44_11975 [bacterium]|nr:MAG: hypothetical protein EPO44_11975 [bacterium]